MNKGLTLLTLLATTQAAAPLSRVAQTANWWSAFPNYADNAAADINMATQATTQGYVKTVGSAIVKYGGYACIRKGMIYSFPQTRTTNVPVTASSTVSFWAADSVVVSTTTPPTQGAITDAAAAADAQECIWTLRVSGNDGTAGTPLGLTIILTSATTLASAIVAAVPFYQGALNQGIEYQFLAVASKTTIQWNNDFLLASTWQNSSTVAAGLATDYCTQQWQAIDATLVTSKMITSGGKSKCTWQVESAAAKGGAQMALTKASFTKFNFQWAEWEGGALAAGTQLSTTTDITPIFMGTITKEWPNPIMAWQLNGAAAQATFVNGAAAQPTTDYSPDMDGYTMSPGKVMWWPSEKVFGAVSETAYATMDFMQMNAEYTTYNNAAAVYNSAVTSYNTDKDAYNKALADEAARKADFFKAMFDPAVVIPTRPCQPTQPNAFSGIDFKYDTTTPITTAEKAAMKGSFSMNGGVTAAAASFKVGYQLPSNVDTALTAANGAGHTYGFFGAGDLQVVTTNKAFQWKASATAVRHMMVSILPYNYAEAVQAAAATVEVTFNNKLFDDTVYAVTKPSQPGSTTAPDAVGAKALAASCVAVAAVAASLF